MKAQANCLLLSLLQVNGEGREISNNRESPNGSLSPFKAKKTHAESREGGWAGSQQTQVLRKQRSEGGLRWDSTFSAVTFWNPC